VRIKRILQRLRSAIVAPREELSRWERVFRFSWELLKQGTRQLTEDRASMMAASLTYRTLFGLLPVTVVGAGVARTIMGVEKFELFMQDAINAAGLDQVQIDTTDDGSVVTLGQWLSDLVSSGMNVNIAAMTWVGLIVLMYSAITLLVNIENSFNVICRQKQGRSWFQRVPIYWFALTFGPILAALTLWVDDQVGDMFLHNISSQWFQWSVIHVWNLLITWYSLILLYRFVPTIKLRAKPVIIGAFVSAIMLLIGKASLGLYFSHAVSLRQMYGSLGLVPVFMFWLYLMWLIILLGLQVAAILEQVSVRHEPDADR